MQQKKSGELSLGNIDSGRAFDWGRTSRDYAKYRDIYPDEFYQKLVDLGLCTKGQKVLDLGTGTGVLPRNMARFGAEFTGTDISENQIAMAQALTKRAGLDIAYQCMPAETVDFPADFFDVITACQCFFYFNHPVTAPQLYKVLKENGRLAVLYMAWLPYEDQIAGESEKLILKYNPTWSGCNETRHPIQIDSAYKPYFIDEYSTVYDLKIPFTRESWAGRMKACRGVGASLPPEALAEFEAQHRQLLEQIAPPQFDVLHYAAVRVLKKRSDVITTA